MKHLAVVVLALWVPAELWFGYWTRQVAYPAKPVPLTLLVAAWNVAALALAVWVVVS